MAIKDNHEKILQECKDYILSSSQDFIKFKQKELKDILKAIITQEKWEKDLKTYNTQTWQDMKLPKKEKMLLNMIESSIPKKTDLNFLPTYEDNGISFKFFTQSSSYQIHSEKIFFKESIQTLIKEQILPDIDKELEKSEDHFLTKYNQVGKKLKRAIITAMNSFIYYIEGIIKNENIEKLKEEIESNDRKIEKLEKEAKKYDNPNNSEIDKKKHKENEIIRKLVKEIKTIENENIKGIVKKIEANDNENIKKLMIQIEADNENIKKLIKEIQMDNNEEIRTLTIKIAENNRRIKELLKEKRENDFRNGKELLKQINSEDNETIKELLKETKKSTIYNRKIAKSIKGDNENIEKLTKEAKTNNKEINETIEKVKKPARDLIQEISSIYKQHRGNYRDDENKGKNYYQEFIQVLWKDEFAHLISDIDHKIYHDTVFKNFITNIHNYDTLKKEEKEIKIQEYAQKNHIFYQMLQESNLKKILISEKEIYTPLIEIQSNKNIYKGNNLQMREILKLIYQGEIEEWFFDDIEAILFHPNLIIVYKKNKIQALHTNKKMKEFFYNKELKTHKSVTEIQQDQKSQEKQREYFRKLLFEIINESLENSNENISRDIYKKHIENIYKIKIKNTYKDMKVDSPLHEVNGENITDQTKTYIEQFIAGFPTIFPKYINEINITHKKTNNHRNLDTNNKREAIFHIIDKRKKNMEEIEKDIFKEEIMDYAINLEELEIFNKYPNEYLLVFIERALGKIYKNFIKKDPDFINAIDTKEIREVKKHFQRQNINKDDGSILLNLFIRYGVKYLQKNYKDIPIKIKEYLDSILWEKKQIE